MLGLLVLVTIAGLQAVGLILIVALLIIPPAAFRRRLLPRIASGLIGGFAGYFGSALSALFPDYRRGHRFTERRLIYRFAVIRTTARVLAHNIRRINLQFTVACDHY